MSQPELTDRELIDAALTAATQTSASPAMTLHNVMAALDFDFGDAVANEHSVMQYYADTAINPFVQAQVDAKIVLDAGELERLTQWVKQQSRAHPESYPASCFWSLRDAVPVLAYDIDRATAGRPIEDDGTLLKNMADVLVAIVQMGLTRYGALAFNKALGISVDEMIRVET